MKTIGKKLIVRRGETFVFSRAIVKDDGETPYILPLNLENPYLLITISSCSYRVNGKYKCNYWLDLSKYPKFRKQTPILLRDDDYNNNVLNGYDKNDCVFYMYNNDGSKSYYYYDDNTYKPYSFIFSKKFLNTDTREWIESKYLYELRLLSGEKSKGVLTEIYKSVFNGYVNIPDDEITLYNDIYKVRPDLLKYTKPGEPILNISVLDILQKPEYCIVKSNA